MGEMLFKESRCEQLGPRCLLVVRVSLSGRREMLPFIRSQQDERETRDAPLHPFSAG